MNCQAEYRKKLISAQDAVKLVHSGDWVDYSGNNSFPRVLDKALAERRYELENVKVRGNFINGPIQIIECDDSAEHFIYNTWHCSGYERKMCDCGKAYFSPMTNRNLSWYYENFVHVNVVMATVSPMDKHGYFYFGGSLGYAKGILEQADTVIVEINSNIPRIRGNGCECIHISQLDYVVETKNNKLWEMGQPEPTETDRLIAEHIFPYIPDGACIQLGVGGMPNALGELIADSELKDLGMHTELCTDGFLAMFKAGKLTNVRKNIKRGKGVLSLAIGSKELYEWLDDNPGIEGCPLSYVNDPAVIASNDNMISINGCLNVDLYGQVASETAGLRQISGSGGQLDFVEGAARAKGGKSFLCMSSTFTDKEGVRHSRILPSFNADIVTTPRCMAQYIVTEYGAVNIAGLTTWQRSDKLISIAHPDFREELIKCAERQRIWLPSNKR